MGFCCNNASFEPKGGGNGRSVGLFYCLILSGCDLRWEYRIHRVVEIQRHRDRRPSTPACPDCWTMGTNKVKIDKNLLYRHEEPSNQTNQGRTPYVRYGGRSPKFIWAPCHMMCTAVLIGWDPAIPPAFGLVLWGRYWSAKIDDISLKPSKDPYHLSSLSPPSLLSRGHPLYLSLEIASSSSTLFAFALYHCVFWRLIWVTFCPSFPNQFPVSACWCLQDTEQNSTLVWID